MEHAVNPQFFRTLISIGIALTTAIVILIDQATKAWALAVLQPRIASGEGPIQVVGTWFQLTFVENTGAGSRFWFELVRDR